MLWCKTLEFISSFGVPFAKEFLCSHFFTHSHVWIYPFRSSKMCCVGLKMGVIISSTNLVGQIKKKGVYSYIARRIGTHFFQNGLLLTTLSCQYFVFIFQWTIIATTLPSCHYLPLGSFPLFIKHGEFLPAFFLFPSLNSNYQLMDFNPVCRAPREITETLMASATDGRFRHSGHNGAFMYEEGAVTVSLRVKGVGGPHLLMAVVVMVEELCTSIIIGPRPISWGLLPRSVEVTATVCKSWTPQKGKVLITSWQSFPLITQPEPAPQVSV